MSLPQPWEKGIAAPNAFTRSLDGYAAHLHEQAATGGYGAGGGGWMQLIGTRKWASGLTEIKPNANRLCGPRSPASALLAAALALPGIVPIDARAQAAPDRGWIELKYLDYRDWQPGADRMTVRSPSLYAAIPLSDTLVAEGSLVFDSMSGASPLYYNTLSGASGDRVTDYRTRVTSS
jgi:hypothetical protein